jgi:hypothetical protein
LDYQHAIIRRSPDGDFGAFESALAGGALQYRSVAVGLSRARRKIVIPEIQNMRYTFISAFHRVEDDRRLRMAFFIGTKSFERSVDWIFRLATL